MYSVNGSYRVTREALCSGISALYRKGSTSPEIKVFARHDGEWSSVPYATWNKWFEAWQRQQAAKKQLKKQGGINA